MQAAKDAIKNITSKHGHHDTTVHERVAPAVTNETVTRNQEDRVTTAVDKEVHQDHYHTSVQPVKAAEVLPEQHHHRQAAVQERTFDHHNDAETKERLAAEAGQFRDQSVRVDGQHTQTQAPSVAGEHVHHHVHETIQPVVNKQTVEPHVVHTTVPVHEVHHNAAQHHSTSTLPAVGIDEFRTKGGVLDGRGERHDEFEGAPRNVGGVSSSSTSHGTHGSHERSGLNNNSTSHGTLGSHERSGLNDNSTSHGTLGSHERSGLNDNSTTHGTHGSHERSGLNGNSASGATGLGGASTTSHSNTSGTTGTKPSLMDRLNPMKDTDGDGKKGLMD